MDPSTQKYHMMIEETKLAKQLESGWVALGTYREYLANSLIIWSVLDSKFPLARELGVVDRIGADMLALPKMTGFAKIHESAMEQATKPDLGDLYVLGLGLCLGGRQLSRAIAENSRLPVSHFDMPKGSATTLRHLAVTMEQKEDAFRKACQWYADIA